MNRTPVTSRMLKSIGHEGSTLEVEFHNGGVYRYEGVDQQKHQALKSAPSIGAHFQQHIRPHHKATKVS